MSILSKFKSIDGFYSGNLKLFKDLKKIDKVEEISILGAGNSISKIPYIDNLPLFKLDSKKFIKID